jgi:hypothetical protein
VPPNDKQLFPTSGAIDEELLIGRGGAVTDIARRMLGRRDTLLVEPRQVGKSSTLQAAIQVSQRGEGLVVAHCDLKIDGVQTSSDLGARLLQRAAKTGAGDLPSARARLRGVLGRGAKKATVPIEALALAAEALGVSPDLTAVVEALNDILRRGDVPFDRALAALEAGAQLRVRPTAVVVDEVQEISEWGADGEGVERALAAAARRKNRQLVFAFAGSEVHALEGLFHEDRPLHVVSDRYPLPRIEREDWIAGLRERFSKGGMEVGDAALEVMLEASSGHPLCTMHAAKETYLVAAGEKASLVELVHVEAGLAQARRQLFWDEFTST